MTSFVDLSGLDRLTARVSKLGALDATPLMATFMRIIERDNRRGLLAGQDKDGRPLAPVTYRPVRPKATDARQRNNARGRSGIFGGLGPMAAGLNNNLTSAEYRRLAGKPLIPRGANSRAITNLRTEYSHSADMRTWEATGVWDQFVDGRGRKILPYHLNGRGRNPIRDIAGVRPQGREEARKAAVAWMADQIRVAVA